MEPADTEGQLYSLQITLVRLGVRPATQQLQGNKTAMLETCGNKGAGRGKGNGILRSAWGGWGGVMTEEGLELTRDE